MGATALDHSVCAHCGLPFGLAAEAGGRIVSGSLYCCFGCRFAAAALGRQNQSDGVALSPEIVRLGAAIFLTLNLMVFNWLFYSGEIFGAAARQGQGYEQLRELFAYLQLLLATAVVLLAGLPLLFDALARTRLFTRTVGTRTLAPHIETNLLILLAVFSAYVLSTVHVVAGAGSLYFDTAAGVLVLVTLGGVLEAGARRRATNASSMMDGLPEEVRVSRGSQQIRVGREEVLVGDVVQTLPGQLIAVDGVVRSGHGHIDSRRLRGESRLRDVGPGDRVLAGSASVDGELWTEASKAASESVLAGMEQLLAQARHGRVPLSNLTDRITVVFAPVVVLVAIGAFGYRAASGQPLSGLMAGLSVLLISCPCALGLAAPLASWTALRTAARRGVLFSSGAVLERVAGLKHMFFDKTGTLTGPVQEVERVETSGEISRAEAIRLAAGVEAPSTHPIARAVAALARAEQIAPAPTEGFRILPGVGVEARVGGRRLSLGGPGLARWLAGTDATTEPPTGADIESRVLLTDERQVMATFVLRETIRPEAQETLSRLRNLGIGAAILTGDSAAPAQTVADRLGLEVRHSLLAGDKIRRLEAARDQGRSVGMVGDGLNDAAVLAAADVGISVAAASGLTRDVADIHLQQDSLLSIPAAIHLARQTLRRLRLTLGWAFAYNVVGIGLAAAGLLTPLFSASAMVVSSLLIVALAHGGGSFDWQDPDAALESVEGTDATAAFQTGNAAPGEAAT